MRTEKMQSELPTRLLLEIEAGVTFMPKDLPDIHAQAAWVGGYVRRAGFPQDVNDAIVAKLTVDAEWREVEE